MVVALASLLALTVVQAAPASADATVTIPDAALRACLLKQLKLDGDAVLTQSAMAGIDYLGCDSRAGEVPIRDLTGLEHLIGASQVVLIDQELSDLGPLASLTSLEKLILMRCKIEDASALAAMSGLKKLALQGDPIADVSFVSALDRLDTFYLIDAPADPAGIVGARALTTVGLGRNRTSDYSFLTDMPTVSELTIQDGSVTRLGSLGHSANLARLTVFGAAPLTDITSIAALTGLERLRLYNTRVSSLAVLSGLTQLAELTIPAAGVTDLAPLSGLTHLKLLNLQGNLVTDLTPVAGMDQLETLNVRGNKLTTVHLSGPPQLGSIDLGDNAVTDLELAGLPLLTSVNASGNKVRSTAGLVTLPKLADLALASNGLQDLTGLDAMPALTHLNIRSNQVTDLTPVAASPLTSLEADDNRIGSLPTFTNASGLERLTLGDNRLTEVSALEGLPALATVGLNGNAIGDLSVFAGSSAAVYAPSQIITVAEPAAVGTPTPITLRGPNGSTPTITHDDRVAIAGGSLTYTTPGTHTIFFDQAVGESVFSGRLTRRVGPDADFTTVHSPTLNGVPTVGSAIQAPVKPWTPAVDHFRYQWYVDGKVIPGATEWMYVPSVKDLGHRLKASVTGVKDGYVSVTRWTKTSGKVVRGFIWTEEPKIVGQTRTGAKLSIEMDAWRPEPDRFTYRWYRNHWPIKKATSATYTLTAADLGKRISVQVSGYLTGYDRGDVASRNTRKITQGPVHSSQPVITGEPVVGKRLGLKRGSWGPGKISFRYTWRRDGQAIANAHSSSYVLKTADAGHQITVSVRGDRRSYTAVTRLSGPVAVS